MALLLRWLDRFQLGLVLPVDLVLFVDDHLITPSFIVVAEDVTLSCASRAVLLEVGVEGALDRLLLLGLHPSHGLLLLLLAAQCLAVIWLAARLTTRCAPVVTSDVSLVALAAVCLALDLPWLGSTRGLLRGRVVSDVVLREKAEVLLAGLCVLQHRKPSC